MVCGLEVDSDRVHQKQTQSIERKENYAGSKSLPASIKEKETHLPE